MVAVARLAFSEFAKFRALFPQQRRPVGQKNKRRREEKKRKREGEAERERGRNRGVETPTSPSDFSLLTLFPSDSLLSVDFEREKKRERTVSYLKFHPGEKFFIFDKNRVYVLRMPLALVSSGKFQLSYEISQSCEHEERISKRFIRLYRFQN